MLLVGMNGNRLELLIGGYQFPAGADNKWDSNWLNITIDVLNERGSWTNTDPSLLTSDVEDLADWLESVAEDRAESSEITFLEPNISFGLCSRSGDNLTLRVWFELESRPTWAPSDVAGDRDLWVDLDVGSDDVRRAAHDLRDQLHGFPPRAAPG
jgi:hypothetical protein